MRVFLDATDPCHRLRLFGLSLLERQLRALLEAGIEPTQVWIALAADSPGVEDVAPALLARLPLRLDRAAAPLAERLAGCVREAGGEPVLALEADASADVRLLRHLAARPGPAAFLAGEAEEASAVLRLDGNDVAPAEPCDRLREIARRGVAGGAWKAVAPDELDLYVKKLRRHLPLHLSRVRDAAGVARAERLLFAANYKGSTDFLTRYVYPPLVWRLLRPLARARVHPNGVTLCSVVLALGAVPLFAQGRFALGLACAYAMTVLDSVDGKLARLTYRASKLGNVLDHGLDLVHPPFWYSAWAFAIGGRDPGGALFQASLWLAAAYVLDRVAIRLFTWRTGRSVHSWTPLDTRLRTWISRRNVNLALFTAGLLVGLPELAFAGIVAWQVATLGYHAARVVSCWDGRAPAVPGA
jgi:phosphatidylglycerophosphate synthase